MNDRPVSGAVPPLVTTIIPVFNRTSMLAEAVGSVLAQTYRPIEIVIVDDGSTDASTPEAIRGLAERHPEVRGVRRENGGPGLARETGRLAARGEYLQYLDSDDLLLPRKFELQVAALEANPAAALAYGRTRYTDAAGEEIACTWKDPDQTPSTIFPSFLTARWWETATPLYRASVCAQAGPWTALRLEEDWEYDARIGALGLPIVSVGDYVAVHRDHEEGRLSRGAGLDPARLRDRAAAHLLIAQHAATAGVPKQLPEMQRFARELFLLARQAGAAGLGEESERLLGASLAIVPARDARVYGNVARILGWKNAGRIAAIIDKLR
jgi:hypothetical protein